MRANLLAYVFLGIFSLNTNSESLYKWVDSTGRTHYSDKKPGSQKQNFKEVPKKNSRSNVSEAQQKTVIPSRVETNPLQDAQQGGTSNTIGTIGPSEPQNQASRLTRKENCEAKQREYKESQNCFGRYTVGTRTGVAIKPEAYQNCKDIIQPPLC